MPLGASALTDFATAKAELKLDDADQTDVEFLINLASDQAEQISGRLLKSRGTVTRIFDGNGSSRMILPNWPVNSIAHLYLDVNHLFPASTEVLAGDFSFEAANGILKLYRATFLRGPDTVKAQYDAGFATGQVPGHVVGAILEVVSWNLKRYRGSGIGIRSVTSPDGVNTGMELTIPMNAQNIFEGLRG